MNLQEALQLLIGGGSGAVVYWLMERIKERWTLRADHTRYLAFALSVGIPVVAWLAMVPLGYAEAPATWKGWLEQIFLLGFPAVVVSQNVHSWQQQRKQANGQ